MSVVICTGVPKGGTHLLYKTVDLLGVPNHPEQRKIKDTKQKEHFYTAWYADGAYSFHRHIPYCSKTSVRKLIKNPKFAVILRNPKNVFISRMRRRARLSRFTDYSMEDLVIKFAGAVRNNAACPEGPKRQLYWAGWLREPRCCVVRFEELRGTRSDNILALSRLNAYLETKTNLESVMDLLEGGTATWSGRNSNWEEYWTPRINSEFKSIGGYETMWALGY